MTLWRSNHLLLSYLKQTQLLSSTIVSSISVRHATEIRSRRPVQTDSKTKQRKNTVNPVAQIKKLGPKAGKKTIRRIRYSMNIEFHLQIFSEYLVE